MYSDVIQNIMSQAGDPRSSMYSDVIHITSQAGDPQSSYPSSTLPLPRHEKRRHRDNTTSPQQQPQSLGPVQPPLRRMSIGGAQIVPSYPHEKTPGLSQPLPPSHPPPSGKGGRKLPPTPSEAPYQPHPLPPQNSAHHFHHYTGRPHSRAESEPNPLPLPWRPSLVQKYQLSREENEGAPHMKPLNTSSLSRHHTFTEGGSSNHGNPTHLISPLSQMGGGASSSMKKLKRNKPSYGERLLRPVRPISTGGALDKRTSASVDTNLDMRGGGQDYATPPLVGRLDGDARGHRGQVGPRVDHTHTQPHASWANYRVGSLPRRSRDIQALMQMGQPITSPYNSVQDISVIGVLDGGGKGSITSVDIKSELFSGGRGGGKGGEAWGHDGTRISPYGSRAGSGYANRRVSPYGSTGTSPFGSTTVSPHGSRAVSPRQSAVISPLPDPAGAKVISPIHSRVIGRPVENLGEFPKSKRRHHRRSISANPANNPPSLDYYTHEVNGLDHPGIPNGEHPPHRDRHGYVKPPHHLLPVANDSSEVRRSSAGKNRNHTHPGTRDQYPEGQSHLTEL
ncbi:hypothetical protein GBAR_LOCUS26 [Geodia barretti]|uniref:Uncharacterized protein n=1 Tax=Geodia barretti TaxID=519541 RepID=A0AA35QRX1_GEOBA|nr:hypothetical protein GBAR_LOCUS26 [Geodia barretti]